MDSIDKSTFILPFSVVKTPNSNLFNWKRMKFLYSLSNFGSNCSHEERISLSGLDIDFKRHISIFSRRKSKIKKLASKFLFFISSSFFFFCSSFSFLILSSSFFLSFIPINWFNLSISSCFLFSSSSCFILSSFSFFSFSSSSFTCFSSSISSLVFDIKSSSTFLFIFCIFSNNSMKNTNCVSLRLNLHFPKVKNIFIFSKKVFFSSNSFSKVNPTTILSSMLFPLIWANSLRSPLKLSKVAMQNPLALPAYISNNNCLSLTWE